MKHIKLLTRFSIVAALLTLCFVLLHPVSTALAAPTPTPTPVTDTEGAVQDALDALNQNYTDDPFNKVSDSLVKTVASGYKMLRTVGFMVLILCALLAALLLGVFKNEKVVQENKTWFIRILAVVAVIALIPTIIGLVASIGK